MVKHEACQMPTIYFSEHFQMVDGRACFPQELPPARSAQSLIAVPFNCAAQEE
jgi:hypothetical protein